MTYQQHSIEDDKQDQGSLVSCSICHAGVPPGSTNSQQQPGLLRCGDFATALHAVEQHLKHLKLLSSTQSYLASCEGAGTAPRQRRSSWAGAPQTAGLLHWPAVGASQEQLLHPPPPTRPPAALALQAAAAGTAAQCVAAAEVGRGWEVGQGSRWRAARCPEQTGAPLLCGCGSRCPACRTGAVRSGPR